MNKKNGIIIGIGEALWDVLPEGKKLGGAPANFAYHMSQLGHNSLAISAVGNDQLGEQIEVSFDQKGVSYLLSKVPYPTGTVQVTLDAVGVPCYEIKENVAWDNIPFNTELEALAPEVRAICFGSLAQRNPVSARTINRFLDIIPEKDGCYKIFDINLRQDFFNKQILHDSLERCNILKINDEELAVVGRLFDLQGIDFKDQCQTLLAKYDLKMLILTCGINGSYVYTPNHSSFIETPRVEVADTVGAGDSFTAGFVAAILSGKSVHDAHRLAIEVSAYVCTQNGAMPQLPDELKSRML